MKVWNGYGSEHSMNLVMIGRFKNVRDADAAKAVIDRLTAQVANEQETYRFDSPPQDCRFSDEMAELIRSFNLYDIGPDELEQFAYNVHVDAKDRNIVLTTDESEISAFLKVLLNKGARVEVYSAHDYPDADSNSDG